MSKKKLNIAFSALRRSGKKAFIPYIMAGDGGLDSLEERLLFLEKAGVTAIEIGIPFSDPVADGPTIQEAGKRALEKRTSLRMVLDFLNDIKSRIKVPLILMTYLNPIYKYGIEAFSEDAKKAGISGVIVPDLPIEQSTILSGSLKGNDIALIQLVTLNSPVERIQKIAEVSEGFLYAVTVNGITGARSDVGDKLGEYLQKIKQYSNVPVLAGFGISTPQQVSEIGTLCDGVIVGSKIITLWEERNLEEIKRMVKA